MIKSISIWLFSFFTFLFLMGYIPLRTLSKDKQQVVCTKIFTFPLWSLMTIFNGEANACMDVGILPLKAAK